MEDFKNLSYYDQLREIERQLVKLQDSYRRISSVPQSQPMDLISDLPANQPNFQSIESIKGVLESPHTESICYPMEVMHSPSETLYCDSGHSRFEVSGDVRRPKTMEDEEFEFSTQRVSAKKSHVATSPPSETHVARSFGVEEEPVHLKQVESSQRTLSPTLAPSSRDVLLNLEVDLGKEDQRVLSSSYGHEESESNSIPVDIQESHTFLVRDVKTEIDPCNCCLIDSLVQDHILLISNPEVVFNQSGRERIDAHGRKVLDFAYKEMDEMDGLIHDSSDCVEELDVVFADSVGLIRSVDSRVILNIPSAHKVFVEMHNREILLLVALLAGKFPIDKDVKLLAFLWPFDRGKLQYILGNANGFIFNVEGELILAFIIC